MTIDETYMHRCIELAQHGAGNTAPNPMVGAVLVYAGRIIGEGFHEHYGQAHAEVNCIRSVKKEEEQLISQSVLYVSLEPCAHFGKTPPCADLIIEKKIPKVLVGCRDPFKEVDGKGIEKLRSAGVKVETGILEKECRELNKRFFTFHTMHRPYIILKWAQSSNDKIAKADYAKVFISNDYTNRLVHKWRSEEAAILVGTNTAWKDDPSLNVRLWKGNDPVRLVIDMDLSLPASLKIFDGKIKTIVFNAIKHEEKVLLSYYRIDSGTNLIPQLLHALYLLNIQSVMVEGGTKLLQSFIDSGLWDEARIIENKTLLIEDGIAAPVLQNRQWISATALFSDQINFYKPL